MTVLTSSTTQQLVSQRELLPAGDPDRARLRGAIIQANLPLARHLARRYAGRGEILDDLYQVAALALVRVVDRYDPSRGVAFAGYATPSILGELKRYFRDSSRALHVPRGAQDLSRLVATATSELSQRLGHTPSHAELAGHLRVSVGDILVGIGAASATFLTPLTAPSPMSGSADPLGLTDRIGDIDPNYAVVDDAMVLGPLLASLSIRDRRILTMRYYGEMTQTQIASEVGLSQMHVSRLLARSLAKMRTYVPPLRAMPTQRPEMSTRD